MRYYAEKVNGKGYIFDTHFSTKVPVAVEKSIEEAEKRAEFFNREDTQNERKTLYNKICTGKMSIPEWLHFLKLCEKFEYIVTDDNGIILK